MLAYSLRKKKNAGVRRGGGARGGEGLRKTTKALKGAEKSATKKKARIARGDAQRACAFFAVVCGKGPAPTTQAHQIVNVRHEKGENAPEASFLLLFLALKLANEKRSSGKHLETEDAHRQQRTTMETACLGSMMKTDRDAEKKNGCAQQIYKTPPYNHTRVGGQKARCGIRRGGEGRRGEEREKGAQSQSPAQQTTRQSNWMNWLTWAHGDIDTGTHTGKEKRHI